MCLQTLITTPVYQIQLILKSMDYEKIIIYFNVIINFENNVCLCKIKQNQNQNSLVSHLFSDCWSERLALGARN